VVSAAADHDGENNQTKPDIVKHLLVSKRGEKIAAQSDAGSDPGPDQTVY
jgi:hypothetical protein